jgi:peptide deformylase
MTEEYDYIKLLQRLKLQPSNKIDFNSLPEDFDRVVISMVKVLDTTNLDFCLAPQLGYYHQIAIFRELDDVQYRTFVNPRIIDISPEQDVFIENNVCIPPLQAKVTRPKGVRVRITLLNNETQTLTLINKPARLMQIAVDLFNGVDFISRLNYYEKSKYLRQLKKYERTKLC